MFFIPVAGMGMAGIAFFDFCASAMVIANVNDNKLKNFILMSN
jgi:hypothetical protein